MQYLLWSTSYSQYCSTKSRTALRLAESRNVCTHAKACFFFFVCFSSVGSVCQIIDYCVLTCILFTTHTHSHSRDDASRQGCFPKCGRLSFIPGCLISCLADNHWFFSVMMHIVLSDVKALSSLTPSFFLFCFFKRYHHPKVSPSNPASHGRSSELSQAALRWRRKGCHEFNFRFSPPANQTCVLVQCFCLWLEKKNKTKQSTVWRIALPVEPFF